MHKDRVITLRSINMDDPKSAKEEKDVTKQEKGHKNVVIALILSRTLDLKEFHCLNQRSLRPRVCCAITDAIGKRSRFLGKFLQLLAAGNKTQLEKTP